MFVLNPWYLRSGIIYNSAPYMANNAHLILFNDVLGNSTEHRSGAQKILEIQYLLQLQFDLNII